LSEDELIIGCQKNKPRFQRALVDRYSGLLFTIARRYAKDNHEAEDILQESLTKILLNIYKFVPKGSFEGWMRRITVNTALKRISNKKQFVDLNQADSMLPEVAPDIFATLQAEELLSLISKLPDGYRQIFNLYAIESYSHVEIAGMLGISEGTSRSQYMRSRRMLQSLVLELEKVRL
jgi:RNA polymerase sigma factor (sigma-70 family)